MTSDGHAAMDATRVPGIDLTDHAGFAAASPRFAAPGPVDRGPPSRVTLTFVRPKFFAPFLALFLPAACGGATNVTRPEAALSQTLGPEEAFDELRDEWLREHSPRTAQLRDSLISFVAKFPNDGVTAKVHAYLAITLMDFNDDAGADKELALASKAKLGSARDFVNVVHARALRRKGQPEYALELLRPLVGKMIDPVEREIFLEETALCAVDAKLSYEAVAYMDAWLRGVSEDGKERVREKVRLAVQNLPREVVETTYRSIRGHNTASSYSRDLEKVVALRLGEIAVAENDASLARWLLDPETGGATYPTEEMPKDLGDLATSRRGIKTVYGKMVGLLLGGQTEEERDRSAEVARGVAFALGLPRASGADPVDVRLVTRNDGGDFQHAELALEELTGEGVSVVIAGVGGASADRAKRYCEAHQVPLILVHPGSDEPAQSTMLLGMERGTELPLLATALTRLGQSKVVLVTSAEGERALEVGAIETQGMLSLAQVSGCDAMAPQAGEPRFPVSTWEKNGVRGVIISGPGECARDVVFDGRFAFAKEETFAMTLDATESAEVVERMTKGTRARILSAQTGLFPVLADKVGTDADLARYVAAFAVRPTWWAALGRDAGVLARRAVSPLPTEGATDAREITQRRSIVVGGLMATRTRMWTTDAEGFGTARAIPRAFTVVEWPRK